MIPAMTNIRETCRQLCAGDQLTGASSTAGTANSHRGKLRLAQSVRFKWVIAIAMVLLLQACSNSKLLVSVFYNRMDNKMLESTYELTSFDSEQKAVLRALTGTFHVWHRQSELPRYVSLMTDISQAVADADFSEAGIQQWMDEAEEYSLDARKCLPINFSVDLMQTLTARQIGDIEEYFAIDREEDLERLASRTPEEQIQRRLRNVVKWAGRIDIDITPSQRAILLSAYKRQISLRTEYLALSDEWRQEFLRLVRSSANADFDEKMTAHISRLWGLLETNYPDQWQANRDMWKETTLRFAETMSDGQRRTLSRWLNGMSRTLTAVSRYEPSFKVTDDPSLGCLVTS